VIAAGCPLTYARLAGRSRKPSKGIYWRGYVSFTEVSLLADKEQFPDIRWRKRSGGFGRSGLSSGKCAIRDDGITWRSGGWATPQTEVSGTFDLPWAAVEAAEAYRLPGKIPGLGGGVALRLSDNRGAVEGEFLGSVRGFSEALELSRRAADGPFGTRAAPRPQGQDSVSYFVLSGDDGKPVMLARFDWPRLHECITPSTPHWTSRRSLFEAQVGNSRNACSREEAAKIAEEWGAEL